MQLFNIEERFKLLNTQYYKLYPDMINISTNAIVSDCLSKSYFEICPELKEKHNEDDIRQLDNLNGIMALPYAIGEPINIILSKNKIEEYANDGSMTWYGTYAHELTHAIDFYQIAVKEGLSHYSSLLDTKKYYLFHLWSEYHARKLGYNFLRNELGVDTKYSKKSMIEHIQEIEWPTQFKRHFAEYHETTVANIQMNSTMQLLGRYSVWCDLFPIEFNEYVFKELFVNTPWMYKIFAFLRKHNSLDDIYFHFEDMRLILSENWKGL